MDDPVTYKKLTRLIDEVKSGIVVFGDKYHDEQCIVWGKPGNGYEWQDCENDLCVTLRGLCSKATSALQECVRLGMV